MSHLYDRSRRGLSLVAGPVREPITVKMAKSHMRLDIDDDDDYIRTMLIPAARGFVEKYTRRALYAQKWCLTLDRFPTWGDTDDPYFWLYRRGIVDLVVPPIMKVDSITYVDTAGATKTLDGTFFTLDAQDDYVRIEPVYGEFWPITQFRISTVKINYICGYTDGVVEDQNGGQPLEGDPLNKIPAEMKLAILILVDHFYENREYINMSMGNAPLPFGVEDILGPFRSIRF